MEQLQLWEQEQKPEPVMVEQWIECIHFDGSREVVSTNDETYNWRDMTVWSARFVKPKMRIGGKESE